VTVLEEFVHLLSHNLPVVSIKVLGHVHKLLFDFHDGLNSRSVFNKRLHRVQMLQCDEIEFLWLDDKLSLVLQAHEHQIE